MWGKNMKRKIICISLIVFSILLVGCNNNSKNNNSKYSNLQSKYIEICEKYKDKPLTKNTIEEIVGLKALSYNKGEGEDCNSYTFIVDDEEFLILTDNKDDKLVLANYKKDPEIDLAYCTKKEAYVGDYTYGFTTKVKQNTLENQKQLIDKYLNEK